MTLDIPVIQQRPPYTCGKSCLWMVLTHFRKLFHPEDLAKAVDSELINNDGITTSIAMARVANNLELNVAAYGNHFMAGRASHERRNDEDLSVLEGLEVAAEEGITVVKAAPNLRVMKRYLDNDVPLILVTDNGLIQEHTLYETAHFVVGVKHIPIMHNPNDQIRIINPGIPKIYDVDKNKLWDAVNARVEHSSAYMLAISDRSLDGLIQP